ncbi:hypothetical protein BDN70DRAFT_939751 [Pholiota conissans]|uniref:Uncharacterized protein n=1 Tax=Pholiota conissans TaxID=109636 RepID=A0A9P5YK44_9AGAR|nr:hypothetical protein BDN70DRAFT_939751 [Pholiota conissans]
MVSQGALPTFFWCKQAPHACNVLGLTLEPRNCHATCLGTQFSPYACKDSDSGSQPVALSSTHKLDQFLDKIVYPLTAPPSFNTSELIAHLGEDASLDDCDLSDLSDLSKLSDPGNASDKSIQMLSDMDIESDNTNTATTSPLPSVLPPTLTHNQRAMARKNKK